ncbi:MAG: zinc ribbon domain-containing protein [Clostridia bacterium]|nr:zinc ribbon domain-containing protein [Clostridia bacterium]
MAKFCTGCGMELTDGLMFCTGCGTKVPEGVPTEEKVVKEPVTVQAQPEQQQQYIPPMQALQQAENHSASTAHFFWMMLVYALPLIGWFICIIMAFAPKNESKKHFARAILIWGIVGIVISIIGLIILSLLGGGIAEVLSEIQY